MPELLHVHDAAKIRAFGPSLALDTLIAPADTLLGRIAPDELLVLGRPGAGPELVRDLEDVLDRHGPRALVVDHTDGWSCFAVVGDGVQDVFGRVTHIPFPAASDAPVFLMGRVCDVAGKLFVRPGRIDILTGAEAIDHVQHRLEDAVARADGRSAGHVGVGAAHAGMVAR